MPELPEIITRARQMQSELTGKTIANIEILQPKCLNVTPEVFRSALTGARINAVSYRGKWIFVHTSQGWLLLNLGMGGEILLVDRTSLPAKYRLLFHHSDGSCLSVNFWWFGYAHFVDHDQLPSHDMTARLGLNAIDVSLEELQKLIAGNRARVKSFLLDQTRLAGIGNAYIHDILFLAGLHPLRPLDTLTSEDVARLYAGIQQGLLPAIQKNGAFYEVDLHGVKGSFVMEDILIGYRENQPCPRCGTPIQKIRTGSTTSFICPSCQPL